MTDSELLKPVDIAKLFSQSLAWVSKNYKKIGGIKIGGRVFFPPKEMIYERLFCGEEGVALRLHDERREVHQCILQNQKRGKGGRTKKTSGINTDDFNRHSLFKSGE